ncbi:MAG: sugar phosphate isomerase/epimerase [Phycisphaeraceae bacterium]|nr:sugar phosphate isomerase/epimerase [Phycisphaeraceae bacterium]
MTAIQDLSKLCVHTITTKPWSVDEAAVAYEKAGIKGISVWRDTLSKYGPVDTGRLLRDHGLSIVSLVRGGFFAHAMAEARVKAMDDNKTAIDEAAALGSPLVVLVCGAVPGQPLTTSRDQIRAGIEDLLDHAETCGVKLAIEPLHPMYADDRSAINTLAQANDMTEAIDSSWLGVAVDVYHLWWDPDLEQEIKRCGDQGHLFAYHICDWKTPTKDMLLDRGLMGEGCINLPQIRGWVEDAGFQGFHEVEIFSDTYWQMDQSEFLNKIKQAYLAHA